MRKVIIALLIFLSLATSSMAKEPSRQEIKAFFNLVQTGGHEKVEKALKANPALATSRDRYRFRPIHFLDVTDFDENLELLLKYGADIDAQDYRGFGLIHTVAHPQHIDSLVNAGADVDLKDNRGRTPIMVHLSQLSGISFSYALIEYGADLRARDKSGKSVLDYAIEYDDETLIKLVRKKTGAN